MWDQHCSEQNTEQKSKIKKVVRDAAPDAAYAAWNLGNWSNMKTYAKNLDGKLHSYEKNFYSAVYLIKYEHYGDAIKRIEDARDILNTKITSLLGESYNRAYEIIKEL